jgi:Protein of unknown function (DUF1592)/Protein of unknown function (DUF1588)/Protein of unknown function (DUF1585)/Protein of unknown function (DUF1595)
MKQMRLLIATGALCAALSACGSEKDPDTKGGADPSSSAGGADGGASAPGGAAQKCVSGIPGTSQIPRLLNRQYEAVVRDLLGVTSIGADNKTASQLLVADSDGPMTPDAWRIYQDVGSQIAHSVMAGPNKSKFMSCDAAAAGCLEQTIRSFGRKAFRRPLSDAEVARFQKLGQTTPAGTPSEVAETTLYAFLVSPSFILLPELTTTQAPMGKGIQLSGHETATRLSFLLWGSVPDDALNKAADDNQLETKAQILAQAERMIAVREKTGPLVASFHRDWVQMNNGNAHWWKVDHDTKTYPLYSADAKPSWQAELDAFFQEVAFAGGSFKDLLLSNVAFVNKQNAAIYGLDPAKFGTDLMKVQLDAAQRPGFMTRAGFLSSYAGYNATSPILRGAFISVYMLGVNPGPPIPGATMMTVSGDFKTQRAYVEALTKPDQCAGCHAIVNPPGFALENFDGIGKWQTADPRGGAIDATVTTASVNFGGGKTKQISSPLELMQEIAGTPKAKQLYAQAWVAYAFGRDPNANDQCVVDQLDTKLSEKGYSILNLLADLTQADSFRLRARTTP